MTYGTVQANAIQGSINTFSPNSAVFRNRIINGGMVIDQRNAGASVNPTSGTDTYTLDRFSAYVSQANRLTVQQDAGAVTPPVGFTDYLGVTSSSAYSITSSDWFTIGQRIEGFNCADLMWGTANARTVTLSFWVRSSLTGTFGGSFRNGAGNRSYPFTYTISSANTWEYKTITVAGDTSGTWAVNNTTGITIFWGLGVGSSNSGTAGAWAGSSFGSATGATSVVGTNGATFYLTGVQLEVGTTATSFDYRPYGTELALCQRYFNVVGKSAAGQPICTATYYSATSVFGVYNFPVEMRTSPTISVVTGTDYYAAVRNGGQDNLNSFFLNEASPKAVTFGNNSEATGTSGHGAWLVTNNASSFLALQSEL